MKKVDERLCREQLVEYGKTLLELGLVQGTWGNMSVRISENYMMTTPSGLDYNTATLQDMVKVDIKTLTYGNGRKPTSEKSLHGGIYELHPEVGAVIHTHSKYCSIFGAAQKLLQVIDEELKKLTGELIYVSEYAVSGTKALTKNAIKALSGRPGCILANHGMIACGKDLEEALAVCIAMESAAAQYIEARYK